MKNGDTSLEYLDVKKITSQMNLSSLGDGVSDIEIRIWFPDMSMDKLIQIKKDNGVWSGNLYCFDTEFDTTLVGYKVAKLKTIPISPKSGWGNMDQKIIDLEILSIPNMEKVAGTKGKSIDGESYSVEVATSRIYRFYTYDNPKDHKNIPEVNQMVNIIEWFNSEFPDCSSN
ncbi:MAG: hypothetical protein ABIT05_06625 [Chitinophagaceae bacterium]